MTILAYGALNPDLVHHVDRIPGPGDDIRSHAWDLIWGGKVANAAVALAGWGSDVRLTGLVIGEDALGAALLGVLDRPGIDLSHVVIDPAQSTRHCVVLVAPDGERTIVCTGYEGAKWSHVGAGAWDGVAAVLLDGFCGEAGRPVAEEARRRGSPVVWIDPDPADTDLADVAVWSSSERTAEDFTGSRAVTTVLTSAGDTVRVRTGGMELTVEPPSVEVVDATGAGDVFAGACVWGLVHGWDVGRTVRWAAAAGAALAAGGRGAGMLTVAEVEAFVDG